MQMKQMHREQMESHADACLVLPCLPPNPHPRPRPRPRLPHPHPPPRCRLSAFSPPGRPPLQMHPQHRPRDKSGSRRAEARPAAGDAGPCARPDALLGTRPAQPPRRRGEAARERAPAKRTAPSSRGRKDDRRPSDRPSEGARERAEPAAAPSGQPHRVPSRARDRPKTHRAAGGTSAQGGAKAAGDAAERSEARQPRRATPSRDANARRSTNGALVRSFASPPRHRTPCPPQIAWRGLPASRVPARAGTPGARSWRRRAPRRMRGRMRAASRALRARAPRLPLPLSPSPPPTSLARLPRCLCRSQSPCDSDSASLPIDASRGEAFSARFRPLLFSLPRLLLTFRSCAFAASRRAGPSPPRTARPLGVRPSASRPLARGLPRRSVLRSLRRLKTLPPLRRAALARNPLATRRAAASARLFRLGVAAAPLPRRLGRLRLGLPLRRAVRRGMRLRLVLVLRLLLLRAVRSCRCWFVWVVGAAWFVPCGFVRTRVTLSLIRR